MNRYRIDKSDTPQLEYNNKIYDMDDSVAAYEKFIEVMNAKNTEPRDILAASLGEEAAKEIMDANPRYKDIQTMCILIGAAFKGISQEEALTISKEKKR